MNLVRGRRYFRLIEVKLFVFGHDFEKGFEVGYIGKMSVHMGKEDVLYQDELFLYVECLHSGQQLLSFWVISTFYQILNLSEDFHCVLIGLAYLVESIDGLEEDSEHFVGDLSRKTVDEFAFVGEEDCWDGFDLEAIGDLAELIDVDVEDFDCPAGLLRLLLKPGSHGLACEVPVSIKVDENG